MKVIVAGSRDFGDRKLLNSILDLYLEDHEIEEIVSGACPSGADEMGEQWAFKRGIDVKKFPANWALYGHPAGPIRNREMAEYADALVVFWDGESRGTKSMIREADKVGLSSLLIVSKNGGGK